jgi:hypothetical protein
LLTLCAIACATPPSEEEIDAELRQIARGVKPLGELRCVPLVADSRMDAWAKLAESTAEGKAGEPSKQTRRLLRAFTQAEKRRVAVVTGGPYASLNERVVLDAFQAAGEKTPRLPGLTLVYVSPDPPSDELRTAVTTAGSLLVHRAPAPR